MTSTIAERDGRWHVAIEGPEGQPVHKSFGSYGRAKAWQTRHQAARLRYAPEASAPNPFVDTLGDLLNRYNREVSSQKRGAKAEACRIGKMAGHPLAALPVMEVTSKAISDYKHERLAVASNSTVRIELSIIKQSIETARREWGYDIPSNPAKLVKLPPPSQPRNRRLEPGEAMKLRAALKNHPLVWDLACFATETAMRRGELLAIRWRHVDLERRTVHLPHTKTGQPRTVPLTDGAVDILKSLKATDEKVFPIDPSALRWTWDAACKEAGIADLHFHDLRHEGVSRLFELELSVPEVALISGHKTMNCLFRYTHLQPIELARKLKGRKPRKY